MKKSPSHIRRVQRTNVYEKNTIFHRNMKPREKNLQRDFKFCIKYRHSMRPRAVMRERVQGSIPAQQCKPLPFPPLNTPGFEAMRKHLLHSSTPLQDKDYPGK
jgi:hypothetical protein